MNALEIQIVKLSLNSSKYSIVYLTVNDAERLQELYDKCTDYALLVDGQLPSSTAAREEFYALPDGKSLADKIMLGILNPQKKIIGLIESIVQYPDSKTLWIGLIMLHPDYRCKGLIKPIISTMERFAISKNLSYLMGSVVEENYKVLRLWKQLGFILVRETQPKKFAQKVQTLYIVKKSIASSNK